MISFIVPAHNEQAGLGRTLRAINETAHAINEPFEIIVVDDASTDATAEVALQNHATVLPVNHRQIAATRNSGANAAHGEKLFFVDADTVVNQRVVQSALRWMDKGAAGGALTRFDGNVPLYARVMLLWFGIFMKLAAVSAGSCMFCTRSAFQATGGFDEKLFGGEDAAMSVSLKRVGKFVVLTERVVTSGRRVRAIPGLKLLWLLACMAFRGPKMLGNRASVQKIWYDSNRACDGQMPNSLAFRMSNAIALIILLILILFPVWWFHWPRAVMDSPLQFVWYGGRIVLAHVGLVLWPYAFFLAKNLFGLKRWNERIKHLVLIGVSLWLAWSSTQGVIWTWKQFFHWLNLKT